MGSYLDAIRASQAASAPQKKEDGGLFGLHLPKLGLDHLLHDYTVGLASGLGHLATSLAPGGEKPGDVYGRFGKGLASSALGTLATAAKSMTGIPGVVLEAAGVDGASEWNLGDKIIEPLGGAVLGKEYKPRDFWDRAGDKRGILPALAEDIGNVAIGAGAASKLGKLSSVGKVAEVANATERAAAAGASASDIGRTAKFAEETSGLRKFRNAAAPEGPLEGVNLTPELKRAAKAFNKTTGIDVGALDEMKVADRAKFLKTMHNLEHPYHSLFNKVLTPLGKAATAAELAGEVTPTEVPEAQIATSVPEVSPEGKPLTDLERAMQEAVQHAEGNQGQQATADRAALQARRDAAWVDHAGEPAVTLYRGQGEGMAGEFWTPDRAEAERHAAGGQVLETTVPESVAKDARARAVAEGHNGQNRSTHMLDPYWADLSEPVTKPVVPEVPKNAQTVADEFVPVDAETFTKFVTDASAVRKGGVSASEFLTPRTAAEWSEGGFRMFMTPDGKTGFALDPNGDLTGVINMGDRRGMGKAAVVRAIQEGATTLDAFELPTEGMPGGLPGFYSKFGFKESWRSPWDDELAGKTGLSGGQRPDVVGMELDKEAAAKVLGEMGANVPATAEAPTGPTMPPGYIDPELVRSQVQAAMRGEAFPEPTPRPEPKIGDPGPIEQMQRIRVAEGIPAWAEKVVEKLPEFANKRLRQFDRMSAARQTGNVIRERIRAQEIARRKVLRSSPVWQAAQATLDNLVDRVLPGGTRITRDLADELMGDEVISQLDRTAAIEFLLTNGADEPIINAVRRTFEDVHARNPERMPREWLEDAQGNRTELGQAVDTAVEGFRAQEQDRLDILRSTRKGDKGLESAGSSTPGMSVGAQRLLKGALDDLAQADKLRTGKLARERAAVQRNIGRTEARLLALRQEGSKATERGQTASQKFSQTRLPKGRAIEDVIGGVYRADTVTGLSPGDMDALGLQVVDLGDGNVQIVAKTPQDRARSLPDVAGMSESDLYRRGIRGGRAMEEIRKEANRAVDAQKRITQLQKNLDDMKRSLIEDSLPSALEAQRLESRANRRLGHFEKRLDNPSMANVPAAWGPMWKSLKALHAAAKDDPALAQALLDANMPERFSTIVRVARENGFDPAHVRSFSPSEIRSLVFDNVQLGKRGRDLGKAVEAGTRKGRRSPLARTRSLSALSAAMIEATHELHTNALTDYIEQTWARPVLEGGVMPEGYVGWDPERSFLLTGERTAEGGTKVVGANAPTKMIPLEVKKTLDAYQRDFHHGIFSFIRKATDPWRLMLLTLSPRWYVNNVVGNVVLATKEGVGIQDWARAWHSFRKGEDYMGRPHNWSQAKAGADSFNDALGAVEGSVTREASTAGHGTVIPPRQGFKGNLKNAREVHGATGRKMSAVNEATAPIRRANEVVDELARVAVYHSHVRRGASEAVALERTYKALVDYSDMTPFERQVVRSVVPFYAWQKGMLKLVSKFGIDHPKAMAIGLQLADLNRELQKDRYGAELPDYYDQMIDLPFGKKFNPRAMNPFADAGQLTSPQGIAAAMNPFWQMGVRNALGAPEGGFVDIQRMNEFGSVVPDTSPAADLGKIATGLPLTKPFASAFGGDPQGNSSLQQAGALTGARYYTDDQVQAIIDRVLKSQDRLSGSGSQYH